MKRILSISLTLILITSLCIFLPGCNKKPANTNNAQSKISVGLVLDTGGLNDDSFNSCAWDGMKRAKKNLGFNINYLESNQESDYEPNLNEFTSNNLDAIFSIGYRTSTALHNVAIKNPEHYYIIIDSHYENTPPNVLSIEFKDQESSFLVGYIAAYMTKTNKVGVITGSENNVINRFRYGFESGVNYGAKELNKSISTDVQCANSFEDELKGKEMANSMYASNIDIIFHVAGGLGKGVIDSAKENNKYVIGVDKDQYYLAPKNILTSAMKLIDEAIYNVCENLALGTKTQGISKNIGLKEGGVDIAPTTSNLVPKDVLIKVESLKNDIIEGKITPAVDETSLNNFFK